MNTISAFNSGVQAFQTASNQIEQSAQNIAQQTTGLASDAAPSLEESLISQTEAKTYALAGVKVVQSADEVLGTLLDISV
ncbi:hypothetical protein [Marinobacterium lutimaris]|uniref:Flagellar basal body rod FlgEFG protein C-terminal n=1 Tax=Marinobacterium lutimaris TaxID=568106 RepID=A0A1H5UWC1_9GAMM|nr:hypothetical protein [Marinobacterium lutimaris]SEF79462.1 hypothetical protein SAMN05444390_101539 [Marinobacterium lutimaris]